MENSSDQCNTASTFSEFRSCQNDLLTHFNLSALKKLGKDKDQDQDQIQGMDVAKVKDPIKDKTDDDFASTASFNNFIGTYSEHELAVPELALFLLLALVDGTPL